MEAHLAERPTDAHELFTIKWARVHRLLKFRCHHRSVQSTDRDDLMQLGAMFLWRQCVRCVDPAVKPFDIDAKRIAVAAWGHWSDARRRHRAPANGTDPGGEDLNPVLTIPARRAALRVVVGDTTVTVTIADAEMDAPQVCRRWREGVGGAALARRLGISKQAVSANPRVYGGIYFRGEGRWLFSRNAGRPGRRRPALAS